MQNESTYHFIFFGLTSFSSLPQREQGLATECARLGHRVDFIEIAPSLAGRTHALKNRMFEPLARDSGFERSNGIPNLHIHTPPTLPTGFRNSLTPGIDRTVFRRWFRRRFRDLDLSASIVMVMMPLWWGNFIDRDFLNPRLLIYDICDALEVQSRSRSTLERLRASESALAAEADLITYSAREMETDISERFPDTSAFFLPNAVSRDFIAAIDDEPVRFRNGDPKHIGYIGATNGKWFDADLVIETMKRFPDCKISVIGPVDKPFADRCTALPHVTLHGFVSHDALPQHLRSFDVALIPFRDNDITRVVNPLKLYEYASAGLPVVATQTAELRHYDAYCYLAANREDYFSGIRRALQEDDDHLRLVRHRFAAANTWEQRVSQLIAFLYRHEAAA
ncbi:glycosyltransferase [bacterium]|nr:glycosyltransferase [bacterium]